MYLGKKISLEMYEQGVTEIAGSHLSLIGSFLLDSFMKKVGEKRSLAMSTTQKAENYGLTIIH